MERLKDLFRLSLLLCCGLVISCSNDDGDGAILQEDYPVIFGTAISGLKSTSDNFWDGGENIAIMINSEVKNYTAASGGALTVRNGEPFYWQSQAEMKSVQAWYPYSSTVPSLWTVQSDQSGTGYQQSDLLYAPATEITFANRNSTSLPFYHQTAKVVVNIMNADAATSATDILGITIGSAANLALSGSYTAPTGAGITAGTWTTLPDMGAIAPLDITTSGSSYLKTYAALVIPQDMSGKKFIAVTLSNGNTYYYAPITGEASLLGGKEYTYDITVKNGYLEVEALTDGQWRDEGEQAVPSKDIKTSYKSTDLKPGDYYYSDGTCSDGGLRRIYTDGTGVGAGSVAPIGSKTVIGIVFWVGDPNKGNHDNGTVFTDFGDPALKIEKSGCTHGLVVALQDASAGTQWQTTATDVGGWTNSNTSYGSIVAGYVATDAVNKLRGYNNTQAIREYNTFVGNNSPNLVLPVQTIDVWAASNPLPTSSSGWYLPSTKELSLLCEHDVNDIYFNDSEGTGMRDIVNGAIEKIGSPAAAILSSSGYILYWSSSEFISLGIAFTVRFSNGVVDAYNKDQTNGRVRAILAF